MSPKTLPVDSDPAEYLTATSSSNGGEVRPGRILIIEDERHIARLLDFVLRKAGYATFVANTAEQALAEISAFRPDALLLDLVLPGMTGMEFLRIFRANPFRSSCVVIVLSGHGFEHTGATLAEAGATAQFSKPIAPRTLLSKLRGFRVDPLMPKER